MLKRYRKSVAVVIAITAGAIFGAVNHATAEEEACEPPSIIEGPGAQDTNGDGVATIAEGAVDLNDDGHFGCFEAAHYNMSCFICWGPLVNCITPNETTTQADHLCMTDCNTNKKKCYSYEGYDCEADIFGNCE